MYSLKGFIKLKTLVNNTPGTTSSLGELSTLSLTFSKEKGEYEDNNFPDVNLISFSSKDSETGILSVSPAYSAHVLGIAQRLYTTAQAQALNVTLTDLLNDILNTFASTVNNLESGPLVTGHQIKLPEWVSWNNPALGPNKIKIWFSDAGFRRQYDEFEIKIIPPVEDLNDLFRDASVVQTALDRMTPTKLMEKIHIIKNGNPETVIRAETFRYQNINNSSFTRDITWYVVVYGQGGDNTDVIREQILAFNVANSNFTANQWQVVTPDLYRITEFTIVPHWLQQAIPERTIQAGIYSPFSNPKQVLDEFKVNFPTFTPAHVDTNLQIFVHPYKSISLTSLGGENNKDNKFKLTNYFSDYTMFGTPSADFNRMTVSTQDWSYLLQEMLIIAENDTEYSDLPVNTRRVIRGGKTYIGRNYQGIQFLIYAKSNDVP